MRTTLLIRTPQRLLDHDLSRRLATALSTSLNIVCEASTKRLILAGKNQNQLRLSGNRIPPHVKRTQLDQHKIHRVLHNVSGNFTSILAHRERVGDRKETSVQNFWRYKASIDCNSPNHSSSIVSEVSIGLVPTNAVVSSDFQLP
jgi:hypothetical protein